MGRAARWARAITLRVHFLKIFIVENGEKKEKENTNMDMQRIYRIMLEKMMDLHEVELQRILTEKMASLKAQLIDQLGFLEISHDAKYVS